MTSKKKILIVDDSATMRAILKQELCSEDFELFEAKDGEEALQKVVEISPDLITLDIVMPEMDGYMVCSKIRKGASGFLRNKPELSEVPIVFITALDTYHGRERGFLAGGSDFIATPFMEGEVYDTVEKMLYPDRFLTRETVLIVDSDHMIRKLLKQSLVSEGISVIEAMDGKEAYEHLQNKEEKISILLTDYTLPHMDGLTLCKKVREELLDARLPIIFLTSVSKKEEILKVFQSGATDYISKPFAKEELIARLKVHLNDRRIKRELGAKVKELKEFVRLKDEFLSITAHDLRSPMNSILGFSQIIQTQIETLDKEKILKYIDIIKKSGIFLLQFIDELNLLGQIQAGKNKMEFSEVNLVPLAEQCIENFRQMAGPKEISLSLNSTVDIIPIIADRHAIMRVLNNLLSNAVKFTAKKGRISIQIMNDKEEKVNIRVRDTGIGIPVDKIKDLFKRYTPASRPGTEGETSTGLGMHIIKKIIDAHKGKIRVKSVEGEGTEINVIIPVDPRKFKPLKGGEFILISQQH